MSRVRRAAAITFVTGALGGAALVAAEAAAARLRRYAQPDPHLAMRTSIGDPASPALRLVLLGDASALGVGVDRVADTVGGHLAELLAGGPATNGRRIELSSVAVAGSRGADLGTQVARALLGDRPEVAVVLVGTNDATGLRRRLRDAGVAVVVGTCPDLGAVRAFAPPLRQLAGVMGRRVARAQAEAVREAGGIPVDLAERAGPVFRADAGTFSHDGLHPSADGYRVWAHALYPAVAEAAGVVSH